MLGAERLVYCMLGDAPFTVRMEATLAAPATDHTLTVAVAAKHVHWFDPQTRQRVA
jgi:sn-glycerol 3-phosphate transport system ATP-binding protein